MTKESESDPVHFSDWVALLGFMNERDALQTVRNEGIPGFKEEDWKGAIGRANLAASGIKGRQALVAQTKELDSRFKRRTDALSNESTFRENLAGATAPRFALVELGKVRCSQSQLNLEYVSSLERAAPAPEDLDATVRYCLPLKDERVKPKFLLASTPTANTVSIISENLDLRVMGAVQNEDPVTERKYVAFAYGFGLPLVSVVECEGQFYIRNGNHRAYALLRRGHSWMPCLVTSTDSLHSIGLSALGYLPGDLMMSDRSPILSDFDSESAVRIPRRRMRMMITVHAELHTVPI